jgi:tetratricopeptide (TPR) repeat protein
MVCKCRGRHDRGARAYCRALHLAQKHLPHEHPLFACLYHNLAGLEHARGLYELAEPFARQGLAIRERALGARHPDVGRDIAALAAILDGQGRHEEAESMYREALRIFKARERSERREVAHTLGNLAACLHLTRRPEAAAIARTGAKMMMDVLGPTHPDVQLSLANAAVIEKGEAPGEMLP